MANTIGYIYQSPSTSDPSGTFNFTGSCSGSILNVAASSALPILPGQSITDLGGHIPALTIILWQISGVTGGVGAYQLSTIPGTVASETMYNSFAEGNIWYQTDTSLYLIRNYANTAWLTLGYGNLPGLGYLAKSGGPMMGAITGSTLVTADGLTAIAKPPESLAQNSLIATMADVQALETYITALIKTTALSSISSLPTSGLNANIVIYIGRAPAAAGYLTPINLNTLVPSLGLVYQDGTIVQAADCYGFATMGALNPVGGALSNAGYLIMNDTKGMIWTCYTNSANSPYNLPNPINYMLIAFKPGS